MKKIVCILLSLLLLLAFSACKETEPDKEVTATPQEIEQAIAKKLGEDGYFCDAETEAESVFSYYGFDKDKVLSMVAKQTNIPSVFPDCVIVMKVADGYASEAVNILNDRYAQLVDYNRLYPFESGKVLNARIFSCNNYVLYIVAGARYNGDDKEAEFKLAAEEYKKIDEAVKEIFGKNLENLAVVPEDSGNGGGGLIVG